MNRSSKVARTAVVSGLTAMIALAGCAAKSDNTATPNAPKAGAESKSQLAPYEINMVFAASSQPKDLQLVQDEINKITKAKINATVKLTPIDLGAWNQQTTLMLAANEKVDLIMTGLNGTYGQQVAKGQLLPLDDLVVKYGADIKKVLDSMDPQYIRASAVDGKIYGIPTIRDLAADYGILMRKDLVDKYHIDTTKIKTLDDLDAVFKTIKDNEPDVTPLTVQSAGNSTFTNYLSGMFDTLGDGFGVLDGFDNLKVVNMYETKKYADLLGVARRWYTAGYIAKDAATNKDNKFALFKAKKVFGYIGGLKPGVEQQNSRASGTELVAARLTPPITSTGNITNIMYSVAKNSQNPERSMMFLNLLYSDKDLVNLFDWGIQGKHYVVKSGNIIDYPDGVTATNSGYNLQQGWAFGNQFLSYVWNGDDPEIWSKLADFNKNSVKSKALGFQFNVDPVKTEFAAVTNVKTQYANALETGTIDPKDKLPEFVAKLKAAGIDKIIAEKQKQLDAWAKSNSK